MAGYYQLSTLDHLGGEWVGIMPSDEPPPAWSPEKEPSPRPWGEGLTQAARRRHWSKFQNWGEPMCKFFQDLCIFWLLWISFVGLNGSKLVAKLT